MQEFTPVFWREKQVVCASICATAFTVGLRFGLRVDSTDAKN